MARSLGLRLALLGSLSELVYLLYFLRQFPLTRYYHRDANLADLTAYSRPAFVAFLACISLLFALLALAFWLCRGADGSALPVVLAFGVLFVATLTLVYPITSTDMFSYINQSKILVHYHRNPLVTPPAAFPADPQMYRAPTWRTFPAPYGPLGILLDAVPTVLTGGNVLASLILLKLQFSAIALGCAATVYVVLRRLQPAHALTGAVVVAWNPLVLLETSLNGHNDVAMMLLVLLALLALARERTTIGVVLLTLSALIKYTSILLLPLFLVYGALRQPTPGRRLAYLAEAGGWALFLVVVAYAPFWHGTSTVMNNVTVQVHRYSASLSAVLLDLGRGHVSPNQAALAGWVLFVAAYNYALLLATENRIGDVLRGCFVAMFGFVAFALTNVQVWYALWPVLIAGMVASAREGIPSAFFAWGATVSAAVPIFLAVWYPNNVALVDTLAYLVAFGPPLVAYGFLGVRSLWRTRRQAAYPG
ncbi:MAG: DUF2029 domain-containing protein [Chloroflexi bacterium]|nr:DUF2029 domain-containing protein [Chloroflexota bacterium]